MLQLTLVLSLLIGSSVEQVVPQSDRAKIRIPNDGSPSSYQMPQFDAGPSVGNMLGNHFFKGIDDYNAGRFAYALSEFAYVIARPSFLDGNSRQNEFMSTTYFLMGMIYMHHAEGLGRRNVAREHFEKAIQWNPKNYMAYIELARVFAELRITKRASAIIQLLLELKPPDAIAAQARDDLEKFSLDHQ